MPTGREAITHRREYYVPFHVHRNSMRFHKSIGAGFAEPGVYFWMPGGDGPDAFHNPGCSRPDILVGPFLHIPAAREGIKKCFRRMLGDVGYKS